MEVGGLFDDPTTSLLGKEPHSNRRIADCRSLRAGLDTLEQIRNLSYSESNPGFPAHRYTDWAVRTQ
jgi:hypothetical protein